MKIIKTINIFKIISIIIKISIIFLIAMIWSNYFIYNNTTAIMVAGLITLMMLFLLRILQQKKYKSQNILQSELKHVEECSLAFLFADDITNINFFLKLAQKKHEATKTKNYVIVNNPNNKIILYPFFAFNKFSPDDLINVINQTKKEKANKIVVCTNEIDSNTEKLSTKLTEQKIVLLDKHGTYSKLLKENDLFPECKIEVDKINKKSFKEILKYAMNKKRAKGYLIGSLLLLFSSFIVRNNIYYLVFSFILIILAILSYFNPKFNKSIIENPLN